MTDKEFEAYRKQLQDFAKEVEKDPGLGKNLLINAGIIDKSGESTEYYK